MAVQADIGQFPVGKLRQDAAGSQLALE